MEEKISAANFVQALLDHVRESVLGELIDNGLLGGVSVLRALPLELVRRALSKTAGTVKYGDIIVAIPSLEEVISAHDQRPEQKGIKPLSVFFGMFGMHPDFEVSKQEEHRREQQVNELSGKLVDCYRKLASEDRARARELLAQSIALSSLTMWLAESKLDLEHSGWRDVSELAIHIVTTSDRDRMRKAEQRRRREVLKNSLKDSSLRANVQKQMLEMLQQVDREDTPPAEPVPVPTAPAEGTPTGEGPPAEDTGGRAIRVQDERVDPARHAFYESLGCGGPSVPEGLSFRNRRYVRYLYQSPDGEVIVVIYDCKWVGRAAYLFSVKERGQEPSSNWEAYAQMTRRELQALLKGEPAKRGPVLARFEHIPESEGDWREPIRKLLEGL